MNSEYEDGLNALRERDYKKSKEIFLTLLGKKPGSVDSHLGLSFSLFELGNITDAEKHLNACLSLFESQHRLSEAYVSVRELFKMKPGMVKYTFDLLRIYLKLKFMKSFAEVLLETMDNREILEEVLKDNIRLLVPFIKDKDIKSILSFRAKVAEDEKLNPFENLELANLLFEIGSTDEAKTEFYKSVRAFLNRDLKDKAQALYVKIKEMYPEDNGLELLKKEIDGYGTEKKPTDLNERRKRLKEVLSSLRNENEARVRYSIAVVYKEYARFEEAKEELYKALSQPKSPEKTKAYVLLSQIYIDAKNNRKAIEILENVIEKDEFSGSELVPLEYKLGTIYERIGKLPEALHIYEIAMDKDSDYLDLVEKIRQVRELIEKQKVVVPEEAVEELIALDEMKGNELIEEKVEKEAKKKTELRERILYI